MTDPARILERYRLCKSSANMKICKLRDKLVYAPLSGQCIGVYQNRKFSAVSHFEDFVESVCFSSAKIFDHQLDPSIAFLEFPDYLRCSIIAS